MATGKTSRRSRLPRLWAITPSPCALGAFAAAATAEEVPLDLSPAQRVLDRTHGIGGCLRSALRIRLGEAKP